jgi:hypothetical protein
MEGKGLHPSITVVFTMVDVIAIPNHEARSGDWPFDGVLRIVPILIEGNYVVYAHPINDASFKPDFLRGRPESDYYIAYVDTFPDTGLAASKRTNPPEWVRSETLIMLHDIGVNPHEDLSIYCG